jgi:hypothetical protein
LWFPRSSELRRRFTEQWRAMLEVPFAKERRFRGVEEE